MDSYAADFFAAFFAALAFSFAANSCLTFAAIASMSTLYVYLNGFRTISKCAQVSLVSDSSLKVYVEPSGCNLHLKRHSGLVYCSRNWKR